MTAWVAPRLLPGHRCVPVPTVLITPWQLGARVEVAHMNLSDGVDEDETEDETASDEGIPAMAGFTRVITADDWSFVEPAYPLTCTGTTSTGCTLHCNPATFRR